MNAKHATEYTFGFVQSLDECSFSYGVNMESLAITPPDGQKIGLSIGRAISVAPELLSACKAALSYIQDDSRSGRRRQANLAALSEVIAKSEA